MTTRDTTQDLEALQRKTRSFLMHLEKQAIKRLAIGKASDARHHASSGACLAVLCAIRNGQAQIARQWASANRTT